MMQRKTLERKRTFEHIGDAQAFMSRAIARGATQVSLQRSQGTIEVRYSMPRRLLRATPSLTAKQKRDIRQQYQEWLSIDAIAGAIGCSQSVVRKEIEECGLRWTVPKTSARRSISLSPEEEKALSDLLWGCPSARNRAALDDEYVADDEGYSALWRLEGLRLTVAAALDRPPKQVVAALVSIPELRSFWREGRYLVQKLARSYGDGDLAYRISLELRQPAEALRDVLHHGARCDATAYGFLNAHVRLGLVRACMYFLESWQRIADQRLSPKTLDNRFPIPAWGHGEDIQKTLDLLDESLTGKADCADALALGAALDVSHWRYSDGEQRVIKSLEPLAASGNKLAGWMLSDLVGRMSVQPRVPRSDNGFRVYAGDYWPKLPLAQIEANLNRKFSITKEVQVLGTEFSKRINEGLN